MTWWRVLSGSLWNAWTGEGLLTANIHLVLVGNVGFGSLIGSKILPLTFKRISAGSCPVFHGGLVGWDRWKSEKAASRNQCIGIHPAQLKPVTILRDPAKSGFRQAPDSALVVTPSWLHGGPFWALPLSPADSSTSPAFPALLFLTPPTSPFTPRPAWLSAPLLWLPPAFSLSSHAPLLLFSPSSHDSSSCFLFVSHAPPLPLSSHILIASPHTLPHSPSHVEDLPLLSDTEACITSKAPAVSWGIDKDKWYYVKFHLMTNF